MEGAGRKRRRRPQRGAVALTLLPASPAPGLAEGTVCLYALSSTPRPPLAAAVAVADTARLAVQAKRGQLAGGTASRTLSGHAADTYRRDQHRHLHALLLPGSSHERIAALCLWAPEGLAGYDLAAAAGLQELRGGDHPPLLLATPSAAQANRLLGRLVGPATSWRSATPFCLPRFPKRRGGVLKEGPVDQVLRELALRDKTVAKLLSDVTVLSAARCAGIAQLRAGQAERGEPLRPTANLRLTFAKPIRGPLCLGFNSHFGLGLFCAER